MIEEQTKNKVQCKARMRPITDTLDLIGGKWKLPILFELLHDSKPKRFMELQRHIGIVTAKMLSKELKDLEINQLVKRKVYATTPVTVEYEITEYGKTLSNVITALYNWGIQHRARILEGTEASANVNASTYNCNN